MHMDRVFVGGSRRMLTIWIPIGDVPIEQGPIMVRPTESLLQPNPSFFLCSQAEHKAADVIPANPPVKLQISNYSW